MTETNIPQSRLPFSNGPTIEFVKKTSWFTQGTFDPYRSDNPAVSNDLLKDFEIQLAPQIQSLTSSIVSGLRRSGLSVPYFSIASA